MDTMVDRVLRVYLTDMVTGERDPLAVSCTYYVYSFVFFCFFCWMKHRFLGRIDLVSVERQDDDELFLASAHALDNLWPLPPPTPDLNRSYWH